MPSWVSKLQELVWPAVFATVLAGASVLTSIFAPESLSKVLSLGLAGITMALLAQRA